jgi:hypothetical protein
MVYLLQDLSAGSAEDLTRAIHQLRPEDRRLLGRVIQRLQGQVASPRTDLAWEMLALAGWDDEDEATYRLDDAEEVFVAETP